MSFLRYPYQIDDSPFDTADESTTTGLDLSKLTRLQDVALLCRGPYVEWVTNTLHTIRSNCLQRMSLELPRHLNIRDEAWEEVHQEWLDLDCSLAQFLASRSLRFRVIHKRGMGGNGMIDRVARLLPELTRRGIVDIVEYSHRTRVKWCTLW